MKQNDYLTEEELNALISDVETNDMVLAPSGLLENILEQIEDAANPERVIPNEADVIEIESRITKPPENFKTQHLGPHMERKRKRESNEAEFRRYCIRVAASAAAAIVLVFTMPAVVGGQRAKQPSLDTVVLQNETWKDEKPARNSIMSTIGSSHALSEGLRFNIFKRQGG